MTLPTFSSTRLRRKDPQSDEKTPHGKSASFHGGVLEDYDATSMAASESTLYPNSRKQYSLGENVKRATRSRRIATILSSFSFFISVIFLVLAMIGNINTNPVISSTYFLKLDISGVFHQVFGNSDLVFVNSIARSVGLRDFYQVGLWSYCEGYLDEGITYCSPARKLYWFNPVSILVNQLLSGATITLPSIAVTILKIIETASNLMSGFFLTGTGLAVVCIFAAPLAVYGRSWSVSLSVLTFVTALLVFAASVIATVMFSIFRATLTSELGLNIGAELGTQMMVFIWIGAGGSLLGFIIQLVLCCYCASRRDVEKRRRLGSKHAYGDVSPAPVVEGEKKSAGGNGMITTTSRRWIGKKTTSLVSL